MTTRNIDSRPGGESRGGGAAGSSFWSPIAMERMGPDGSLVLLRAFLGITFTFAGLQKLANPNFFRAKATGSFYQQLLGAIATSPLHGLLSPATHAPITIALLISFGEVAVGLGTLLGIFGRAAAIAGAVLSLSFFLTVSFNDRPYYYGSDLVFLFAWTPLIFARSGKWSLDHVLARRAAPTTVQVPGGNGPRLVEFSRRSFLRKVVVAGGAAAGVLVVGGLDALLGRVFRSPTDRGAAAVSLRDDHNQGQSPSRGTRLASASEVPVGAALPFTDPRRGIPAFVVQPARGDFLAFSAVCTHAGCPVQFDQAAETFLCPCHGSVFSARTGAVLQGPAFLPLNRIPVALGPGSELYVDD